MVWEIKKMEMIMTLWREDAENAKSTQMWEKEKVENVWLWWITHSKVISNALKIGICYTRTSIWTFSSLRFTFDCFSVCFFFMT